MTAHTKELDAKVCEFVIIVGGFSTGKTLNKGAIKRYFRCDECYDCPGEELGIRKSQAGRILILTTDADVKDPRGTLKRKPRMEGVRVSVSQVRELLGSAWIEPVANPTCDR